MAHVKHQLVFYRYVKLPSITMQLCCILANSLHCEKNPYLWYKLCYCKVNGDVVPMNGTLCTDLNECDINNGGCDQICENTAGSFRCSCRPGYNESQNGASCYSKLSYVF